MLPPTCGLRRPRCQKQDVGTAPSSRRTEQFLSSEESIQQKTSFREFALLYLNTIRLQTLGRTGSRYHQAEHTLEFRLLPTKYTYSVERFPKCTFLRPRTNMILALTPGLSDYPCRRPTVRLA